MYTLYYASGACSLGIHVALNECAQPVKLEKVDFATGQNRSPEYLKLNPRGQVPVLVDGDQVIRECAAILLHVIDKHHSPLLPKSGPARDEAVEWLMFTSATLQPAYDRVFFLKRNGLASSSAMEAAVASINALWNEVEQRLSSRAYICGSELTAADIMMTVIANWSGGVPLPVRFGPETLRLLKTVSARPAFQKAMEAEGITYKATQIAA